MNIHDVYRPILTHFRTARVKHFFEALEIGPETTILDVGGNGFFWKRARELGLPTPHKVIILNIYDQDEELPDGVVWVKADARNMPFQDKQFTVVFSNSVIEHLGTPKDQAAMASEIRRVGTRYWIQTPDPRFPVEPHYLTPFVHWLPVGVRRHVVRNGTVWGIMTRPTPQIIEERLQEIRLLPPAEFQGLFPEAKIVIERFAGLPKSMMAVRR